MEQGPAWRLGDLVADFYLHHDDHDQGEANSVNTAISWHAKDALPEGALTAVVESADGLPVIIAASATRLYVIDVVEIESRDAPGSQTRVRSYAFDSGLITVSQRARYGEAGSFRSAEWEIELPDLRVSISGRSYANGEADEQELLGGRIAEAVGWEIPG